MNSHTASFSISIISRISSTIISISIRIIINLIIITIISIVIIITIITIIITIIIIIIIRMSEQGRGPGQCLELPAVSYRGSCPRSLIDASLISV